MNKKRQSIYLVAFFAFMLILSSQSIQASTKFLFQKDLHYGQTSPDVIPLQQFLNTDAQTKVANIGPGSPGNESTFFGAKTASAVSRFQEKYSSDILYPVGLNQGTGYVGARTRQKINQIISETSARPVAVNTPQVTTTDYMLPIDKKIISLMSDKIDQQTADIKDENQRKDIKKMIMATLDSGIKKARLEAFMNAVGVNQVATNENVASPARSVISKTSTWDLYKGRLKEFFSGFAAHAAEISENPTKTLAQSSEIPFGGMHTIFIQCTCSGANQLHYIFDYASNSLLGLVYQPGASILYMNFNVYGTFQKGSYAPGSGQCQIITGPSCSTIKSDGQYGNMPGTGTSFEKGKPVS